MCPIFHVDNIPCRFLVTLYGSGTEWISHDEVDWKIFQERDSKKDPLKDACKIKILKLVSGLYLRVVPGKKILMGST